MVLAADGNTYLGKTTHLLSLMQDSPKSFLLVEEYDTDLELLEQLKTHREKQAYYFSLEEERVRQFGGVTGRTLLLDRSYLSILAHSWAMSHIEQRPHFARTLRMLRAQLDGGRVLIPDRYIFFLQEDEGRCYSDCLDKGSEEILYDLQYRRQINAFFRRLTPVLENGACPIERMLIRLDGLAAEMEYSDD